MDNTFTSIAEFDKSIEELLYFGDCLKLWEKYLEQQHVRELDQQKNEFDIQLQKEKNKLNNYKK